MYNLQAGCSLLKCFDFILDVYLSTPTFNKLYNCCYNCITGGLVSVKSRFNELVQILLCRSFYIYPCTSINSYIYIKQF